MRNILIFIVLLLGLAGCGNIDKTSEKVNPKQEDGQSSEVSSVEEATSEGENLSTETKEKQESSQEQQESKKDDSEGTSAGKKDDYLKTLKEFDSKMEMKQKEALDGTQAEMNEAQDKTYSQWDQKLNEIYGILEQQLPTKDMEQLREEQREWIKNRDEEANKASSKYKGGSLEPLEYSSALTRITKERCYELVHHYMK